MKGSSGRVKGRLTSEDLARVILTKLATDDKQNVLLQFNAKQKQRSRGTASSKVQVQMI